MASKELYKIVEGVWIAGKWHEPGDKVALTPQERKYLPYWALAPVKAPAKKPAEKTAAKAPPEPERQAKPAAKTSRS
ncbi:hypothetical protein HW532_19140 [Kaustia mangrovi]|uniref:Uncharacterized protein n=1 Tax=Kaustia mangrovi TaxID=2593653 RepID=A0A7S8C744_9HYPH|nr:hypothetical protein [Kaustia mangrovi]QPC44630.1 hypothetical protein HW532_19140 [Kaustia mangrovi]